MAKQSKIDQIRNELCRIASDKDKLDLVVPTMKAYWSCTRVIVLGKTRNQAFDFDVIKAILKRLKTGTGEENFWFTVDSTNLVEIYRQINQDCEVIQLRKYQEVRKALA